ncbi:hypothetical protein [Kitasatospora cathayae]|uniref:C1q domain-containing protein n=1 Tax=Kitasatospora cathayae TaxID=3004092 RepID=A0ABY7Q472_9ACTN|nr:hypothetical protein [Kitasatospora sp. HUAS 3-15]WBP87036.1 hypothetical protein O1G21_15080 [Kitasatospora sp. HUAS 3-15]
MTNLPVPAPSQQSPGNFITGALWNANVYNGITFLSTPPLFVGTQGTAQSIPSNTVTALAIDTTAVDTYGGHSNTTNNSRYTAQVAGWYLVIGTASWAASATGSRNVAIAKNGTFVSPAQSGIDASRTDINQTVQVSALVSLAVGDYVQAQVYQSTGGALSTNASGNCGLSVFWLHA